MIAVESAIFFTLDIVIVLSPSFVVSVRNFCTAGDRTSHLARPLNSTVPKLNSNLIASTFTARGRYSSVGVSRGAKIHWPPAPDHRKQGLTCRRQIVRRLKPWLSGPLTPLRSTEVVVPLGGGGVGPAGVGWRRGSCGVTGA